MLAPELHSASSTLIYKDLIDLAHKAATFLETLGLS